ncbi:3-oxoadipate CoA-transferase subunit B [compost metagenome]
MQHVNKAGESKLLAKCTLPLTGVHCIKKVVTELAVLDILPGGGFKLIERAPGVSVDFIRQSTTGKLFADDNVPEMVLS